MNLDFLKNIPGNISNAWKFSFGRLYCEKTGLFYDYLAQDTPDGHISHLPTPEMIASQCPNPCGWGTGMEDSALNGGIMIEALLALYRKTADEAILPVLHDVVAGYLTLATVSDQEGFLARSISPVDGKSHYINSSRDQYTHWVYMSLLFYKSGLATEEEKAAIEKALVGFARKAEREIHDDQYEYLREDGKVGAVCKMWGKITAHEYHRLPMIYLAAYRVSGDAHWKEKYEQYRETAFALAEAMYDPDYMKIFKYAYALLQMQYSLRLIYDEEEDPAYRERTQKLMAYVADYSERYTSLGVQEADHPQTESYREWQKLPGFFAEFTSGYGYYIPSVQQEDTGTREILLRNTAEALVIRCLCPDTKAAAEQKAMFDHVVEKTDFLQAVSYWAIIFCDAWALLEEQEEA